MFIIEAHNDNDRWISGVFEDEEKAKEYIKLIPEILFRYQQFKTVSKVKYPFYIIEVGKEFRYVSSEEIEGEIQNIVAKDDVDYVYFNLYFIRGDYQPKKPGTDYMGILNHIHVDNRFLDFYKHHGMDALTRYKMA